MASVEGWDTTLAMATSDGGSFTDIGEVTDVSWGGITTNTVEDTPLGDQWARFKALGSSQEPITFTVNYSYTEHQTLIALAKTPATRWWKVTFQDGGVYESEGILSNFAPGPANRADRLTASFTIRTSGEPTVS